MSDYKQGKIYKIVDLTTENNIYVGSTCQTLEKRLSGHVNDFKYYTMNNNNNYITSYEVLKNGNYEILLIENYPCDSKYELLKKERYFIETMNCVNQIIPTRTKKEWIDSNRHNQTVCECGMRYTTKNKKDHLKTKQHIFFFEPKIYCICGLCYAHSNKCDHFKSRPHTKLLERYDNLISKIDEISKTKFKKLRL